MRTVKTSNRFEKEVNKAKKRGLNLQDLQGIMQLLMMDKPLEPKHRPHALSGNYDGCWECHIRPDWLLIYILDDTENSITFTRTGTHSDLFG